ncbi:MAG: glycosyltransferase family 4 protein [Ilumatobacter sp.]|uniref:glycosyltransferase family 4 protein n=1 Tax=Ilumatobacter sp. TaxID=1967498 RepID=UPI00391B3AC6
MSEPTASENVAIDRVGLPAPTPGTAVAESGRLSALQVAVNLLWCVPGDVGGSEQYLVRQLLGLAGQPAEFVPTIYCLPAFVDAHPELSTLFPMVTASITGDDRVRRVWTEHSWLARRTRSADVVHHGGGTVPRRGGGPVVLTIHDLQYETYPEYISPTKLRYLRAVMPRSAARASVITVPSGYVKATVADRFEVDPDRILVVPHGVEPTLGAHAPSSFELRRDYGLGSGRVIVFPAITHPHKGHEFLLEVLAAYWDDPDLRLVLLGGAGAAEDAVEAAIERLGLRQRVVRPGRVPDTHRDGLIAMADALVFPSEYEGFGAPVVEAMALGTPVICADQAALAEVVGDAGLVLPRDPEAWAGALDHVAEHGADMRVRGHRRARSFTSAASGAGLAAAYRLAAGDGGR